MNDINDEEYSVVFYPKDEYGFVETYYYRDRFTSQEHFNLFKELGYGYDELYSKIELSIIKNGKTMSLIERITF